ncbi:hypothetical protein ACWT_5682 [Actinoplanes sp. SE50]|uniref:hypothetical protein n=1 Tax=unclassified Actinoplanes TaxID=2626549 RepID=UPI00023ED2D1|nr:MULTISPECIES: hypothetical protein [unclassified Actinoplanes]AEV86699.1 hypothetical protein ACPL_5812 [Actinoplanes sp. SE50/110]ATO85097.1 hypothetical protein ACWT_5682 [Actinoplanes sp. SE50]SLM02508.1 hypothetical protein ACSP50_5758 [Actinoplanes sp. SE50/110]
MTLTRFHTTEPFDGGEGGFFHWWVSNGPHMLALTVIESSTKARFNEIYMHQPSNDGGCRFHDGCEPSALSNPVIRDTLDRIVAAGTTDDAVYAELERLHGEIFAEVAR